MCLKMYNRTLIAFLGGMLWIGNTLHAHRPDTLFLPVDQLFEQGVQHNLQLQAT